MKRGGGVGGEAEGREGGREGSTEVTGEGEEGDAERVGCKIE
jgi:hypothetical protein